VGRPRLSGEQQADTLNEVGEVQWLRGRGHRVAAGAADVDDVGDYAQDAVPPLVALPGRLNLALGQLSQHPVPEHLRETHHHVQGSAQLVADVGHKALLNRGEMKTLASRLGEGWARKVCVDDQQHKDQGRRRQNDNREGYQGDGGDVQGTGGHYQSHDEKQHHPCGPEQGQPRGAVMRPLRLECL